MTNKKEQFKQATIFDQMRFNAQDEVKMAKREYDRVQRNYESAKDTGCRFKNESVEDERYLKELNEDVEVARNNYNDAREHYSHIVDEIKKFEK